MTIDRAVLKQLAERLREGHESLKCSPGVPNCSACKVRESMMGDPILRATATAALLASALGTLGASPDSAEAAEAVISPIEQILCAMFWMGMEYTAVSKLSAEAQSV